MKKFFLISCLVSLFVPVFAANVTWNGGIGDWNDNSNWDLGIPGSVDSAYVKSGEAWVTGTVPLVNDIRPTTGGMIRVKAGGSLTSNQAKIGANGGNGTLYIEGGNYSHVGANQNFEVGKTSGKTDYVIQTGGTVTMTSGRIELGDDAGTSGIYSISGGTLRPNCTIQYSIGDDAYGELNISDNANVYFDGWLQTTLGVQATGSGRINISGGTTQFERDIITGLGTAYFKVEGSGSAGDYIKVDRQFKLDRGISSTVEFVLDSGGVMPIQTGVNGWGGATNIGFYIDNDTTLILDTLGDIGASFGDTFILATGPVVQIAGANIVDNSALYDFELNIISDYTPGYDALQLTIVPEPATLLLLSIGGVLLRKRR